MFRQEAAWRATGLHGMAPAASPVRLESDAVAPQSKVQSVRAQGGSPRREGGSQQHVLTKRDLRAAQQRQGDMIQAADSRAAGGGPIA